MGGWRAVPLSIWASRLAVARDGAVWLSGRGLYRIADLANPKPKRVTRSYVVGMFQTKAGGVIFVLKRPRSVNAKTFAKVVGRKLKRIAGLKTRGCHDVTSDGTIGVYYRGKFSLRTPDGKITKAKFPAGVSLGTSVCHLKVDGARRLWTISSKGPAVLVDGALKVLQTKPGDKKLASNYADVVVLGKGSSLEGFVPLR